MLVGGERTLELEGLLVYMEGTIRRYRVVVLTGVTAASQDAAGPMRWSILVYTRIYSNENHQMTFHSKQNTPKSKLKYNKKTYPIHLPRRNPINPLTPTPSTPPINPRKLIIFITPGDRINQSPPNTPILNLQQFFRNIIFLPAI